MYMIAVNEYIMYIKCVLIQMIYTCNSLFHNTGCRNQITVSSQDIVHIHLH